MKRFLRLFGLERLDYLTADREFKGARWIRWLQQEHIPFRIRIANNTLIFNAMGLGRQINQLIAYINRRKWNIYGASG